MTTAAEILNKAAAHLQDRASTYDKPSGERSMGATVAAFSAITGITLSTEQGWLFMTVLKAVRSQQGAFKADNYEDGAAYFALACEVAEIERMSMAEVSAKLQEIAKPARAEELQADDGCGCRRCDSDRHHNSRTPFFGGKMTVCAKCGNKRCPKAQDHKFKCSGSNDTGQVGVLEAADDGWIEWGGGDRPVYAKALVQVKRRNGDVSGRRHASACIWSHYGLTTDVIAYRRVTT